MQWFKNLRVVPKLMICSSVLLLIMAVIGYQGIACLATSNAHFGEMYNADLLGVSEMDQMSLNKMTIAKEIRDAILSSKDAKVVDKDLESLQKNADEMRHHLDAAKKLATSPELQHQVDAIGQILPLYLQRVDAAVSLVKTRHNAEASQIVHDYQTEFGKKLDDELTHARETKLKHALSFAQNNDADYRSTRTIMLSMILAAIVIGIGLSTWTARLISVPLGMAVNVLKRIAQGDLTASLAVHTKDEVGQMARALNEAIGNMRQSLEEVSESSINVSNSAAELAAAAEAIARGAAKQASSLEETAASLEEITATVRQSADNATQANQFAASSRTSAEQGGAVVESAVAAMSEINAASAKIADIIGSIDEIAFQTNLLAVNAAVEAARAGEEGRGFAVVATEVRQLAQRSAASAKQIKALIKDSLAKVENGSKLVNRSGETLRGIVTSVKRVTDIVGEIASAAQEQSIGVDQVNTAMTQMDQVTQSNSSQTEELSATAQAMSDQSARLLEVVQRFVLHKSDEDANSADATYASSLHTAKPALA